MRYWGRLMAINEYRRHAAECLAISDDITTSSRNRILLIGMAQAWLRLAQQTERDLVAETVPQQLSPSIEPPAS